MGTIAHVFACRLQQKVVVPKIQIQCCHGEFFASHARIYGKFIGWHWPSGEHRATFPVWPKAKPGRDGGANEWCLRGTPKASRPRRSYVLRARKGRRFRETRRVTRVPRREPARDARAFRPIR